MSAAGDQKYLNAAVVGASQGIDVHRRNVKLGTEQGAVNIHGQHTGGKSHWSDSNIGKAVASVQWADQRFGSAFTTVTEVTGH
jgi:hypothetical protein